MHNQKYDLLRKSTFGKEKSLYKNLCDGRIIEQLGTYNPAHVNAPEVKIDEELALKWLHDGAKPTDTVHNILSREGILKKFDEQKNAK